MTLTELKAAELLKDNRVLLGLPLGDAWSALENSLSLREMRNLSRVRDHVDAVEWLDQRGQFDSHQQARRFSFARFLDETLRIGEMVA